MAFVLVGRDTRQGLAGVLRTFFNPVIVLPLILAALYASGEIYLTTKLGWWSLANLKTTVIWIVTFAFVTMFEVVSAKNRKCGLGRITKEIFTVATVLTFITELQSFPLLVELIALPAVAFIVMAAEVAKHRPEHASDTKLFGAITAMIGLGYFGFSLWMTIAEWQKNATWANALEFALPIWLSVGFLPFLYGWRIYIAYSETFVTISIFGLDPKLVPFARWLAITRIGSDIDLLERWRCSIQHSRPADKIELRHSLTALLALKAQENAPPDVPPQQGWSPYLAMKFMTDMGFETGHYHHSFEEEWCASSLMCAFGNGMPMPNNIAYYIEGNASAANILKLKLNVNDPASPNEAENMFVVHCMYLLEQAVSLNAVERMKMDIATLGEFENEIPYGSVALSREDFIGGIKGGYSRKFELRRGLPINGSS
ncbi:hypothetical protein NT2_17_00130 [Caenibius tardaugens NBRC 16725]|uniref:Uncharacterized protein n=1 Tax=Caenibius tardaugens NBRC 16725 TaxID=1219035 RepID=U2YC17_9SPHN|nr:hypothetical protein NT2_17_00130 [Caenibius tardaugens NBRC 16725]